MDLLREALDELVPEWDAPGDWSAVRGRARKHTRRRRAVAGAMLAALLVPLLATPAFGLRHALLGWVGRLDVPFRSATHAPLVVRKQFYDLDQGAPRQWAIKPLADKVRKVADLGGGAVLYVGPTAGGGLCWQFTGRYPETGCLAHRPPRRPIVNASYAMGGAPRHPLAVTEAAGLVTSRAAARLVAEHADGSHEDVPFVYVSKPIDAGLFRYLAKRVDLTLARRLTALVAYDAKGRELGRQTFHYPTKADLAREARREAAVRAAFRSHRPRPLPRFLPATSGIAPRAPLRRAAADGVTVVAGRNGVVLFDLTGASAHVRGLLGRAQSAGCIRFASFHGLPDNREILFYGRLRGTVALRIDRQAPFDACEIQGSYGHVWPDRNGGHSAVELPFSARAERYFDDRAAARDLALFVRSRHVQELRKLPSEQFVAGLAARYGTAITRGEPAAPGRIGYLLGPGGPTFVERSPTGRRFFVRISHGHVRGQNLKPLAFPF